MNGIEIKEILKQGRGKWLVVYTVPFCCGWYRKSIIINKVDKPTEKEILHEIKDRDNGL